MSKLDCIKIAEKIRSALVEGKRFKMPLLKLSDFNKVLAEL